MPSWQPFLFSFLLTMNWSFFPPFCPLFFFSRQLPIHAVIPFPTVKIRFTQDLSSFSFPSRRYQRLHAARRTFFFPPPFHRSVNRRASRYFLLPVHLRRTFPSSCPTSIIWEKWSSLSFLPFQFLFFVPYLSLLLLIRLLLLLFPFFFPPLQVGRGSPPPRPSFRLVFPFWDRLSFSSFFLMDENR